jgi:arabinofuranan 3-O-arabinosyltransferase
VTATATAPAEISARSAPTWDLDRWLPLGLAVIVYLPLLFTHPGMVGADTKQYLYLDPGRMLSQAWQMWDPSVGTGTVTHQNIGYLLPMGPWYWTFHALHVPTWVAQRLWTGTLLFVAGLGMRDLCHTIGWGGTDRARAGRVVGVGVTVASLSFMLTPYVLEYVARISAILMPWAALPWMISLVIRALRTGSWRHPALFALVIALCGGVNATSLIFAGIAPVLWFPFAVWVYREVDLRRALSTLVRVGVLTILTNLWWMAGLLTQAGYGLDVLRYTETVQVVAQTGFALEALRGLGNWYFYGRDAVGAWVQPATEYTQQLWHLAISYLLPIVAFVSAIVTKWRTKLYFITLIVVGTALVVGVHPYSHPTPLGSLLKAFANSSSAGLALRSVGRAAPLIAIGTAALLGAGAEALVAYLPGRPRLTTALSVGLCLLIAANMAPLFTGQFVDDNLQRPNSLPSYWPQAASYLNAQHPGTRVLELPGADFSHYRWGTTLDPVTPGLMSRPFVGRELIPYGSAPSADLLRALDERLQNGVFEPQELAPIARLISAGDIDLRSDLQYERFLTPRPVPTWSDFSPSPPGLTSPTSFGPLVTPATPTRVPLVDEITLETPTSAPNPPAVAVFGVNGVSDIVHTQPVEQPMIVAGSGDGLVDLAAAGVIDGSQSQGPILYAAALNPNQFSSAMTQGADLVLTDSNRRQAQRWGTIRYNLGYTEEAGEQPLVSDPTDARLPVFPGAGDDAYTVAEEQGVASVRATQYGNPVSFDPGVRPDQALDGDVDTAWEAGAFSDPTGATLQIDLTHPVTTSYINLVQPLTGANERYITKATITFDGQSSMTVAMQPDSRTAAGQTVTFPTRTFQRVGITVDDINFGKRADYSGGSGVGLAEVRIPGVSMQEVLRLPTDLLTAAGASSLQHNLTIELTRLRANPQESFITDPELNISRTFSLPTARTFSLTGTVRLASAASDDAIDANLGRTGGLVARSSSHLAGQIDARAAGAVDGDPSTAWQTDFGPQEGNWLDVTSPTPVSFDHIDLSVVADGHHSVPTAVQLNVDGKPGEILHLPSIVDRARPGATVTVRLPVQMSGREIRLTIVSVRQEQTINYFSKIEQTLPIGIAELGVPGLTEPQPTGPLPGGCRADLLSVDGQPVPLRITGTAQQARALAPMTITPCDGPLVLGPGGHTVETAVGSNDGMDVDRLVFSSAAGGGAAPLTATGSSSTTTAAAVSPTSAVSQAATTVASSSGASSPAVHVTHNSASSVTMRIATTPGAAPFWLVFGQSLDTGWHASANGHSLGKPVLVNGYANGWLVTPPAGGGPITVSLTFAPQRIVNLALLLSALGILLAIALALIRPHRSWAAVDTDVALPLQPSVTSPWAPVGWRPRPAVAVATVATAGLLSGLVIAPAVGVGVAVAVGLVLWRPRWRALLSIGAVALLAVSTLYVLQLQVRYRFPTKIEWPEHFDKVALIPWAALALLCVDATLEVLAARRRDRHGPSG